MGVARFPGYKKEETPIGEINTYQNEEGNKFRDVQCDDEKIRRNRPRNRTPMQRYNEGSTICGRVGLEPWDCQACGNQKNYQRKEVCTDCDRVLGKCCRVPHESQFRDGRIVNDPKVFRCWKAADA